MIKKDNLNLEEIIKEVENSKLANFIKEFFEKKATPTLEVKMNNTEVIIKLRTELEQLRQKIMNLKIFILTEKFKNLETKQRDLLLAQRTAMLKYQEILIDRIALIQDLIDNKKV